MKAELRSRPPLEVWGGVECTVNRVKDEYLDQLALNGHAERIEDLELFAQLGIRAMRYPVLWERTAPEGPESADWTWADERLERLRRLDIRPIVGLVHHGSGPRHTSLIDPAFPEGLAQYAGAVAQRYPWVEYYTPVNEPLTTARFSGLYGHWYPHGRDGLTFARALLTQCRAVGLAMRAIRAVNPEARLVQTDDLGKTYSTRLLAYQAEFDNERRWLAFDLLCGRVDRDHSMWGYLRWLGVEEAEIDWFRANPCPPDILGINYYITSERFLDHRLERYPACCHGGNGRHRYADVEAVRVCAEGPAGAGVLLREAWERYRRPLAVTEAHLGCTREEQVRWLLEVWNSAQELWQDGVDVRAVTAWSLLGAFDWNSLLTRFAGHYEPGVYDVRGPGLRPTAIAGLMRELAAGVEPRHPVLAVPGWWRRPQRLLYPEVCRSTKGESSPARPRKSRAGAPRPLLIAGGAGTLGAAFARLCDLRGLPYRLLSRKEMDIAEPASVERALAESRPWAVINTAGYASPDDAEYEPERCRRENTEGPAVLAAACARHGAALVTFSSDLVFDGNKQLLYVESDPVAPLSVFGRSKAEAERRVLEALPSALVVRTSPFFGPWDDDNFVTVGLRTLAAGLPFVAAGDAVVSPTYVPDLVHTALDLLVDGEAGLWHLASPGATSWADLARWVAERAGLAPSAVEECPARAMGFAAPRPAYSVLGSERGVLLPPLEDALVRYMRDCEGRWADLRGRKQPQRARVARKARPSALEWVPAPRIAAAEA